MKLFKNDNDGLCKLVTMFIIITVCFMVLIIFAFTGSGSVTTEYFYMLVTFTSLLIILSFFLALFYSDYNVTKFNIYILPLIFMIISIIIIFSVAIYSPMLNGEYYNISDTLILEFKSVHCNEKNDLLIQYENILIGDYEYSNQFLVRNDSNFFRESQFIAFNDHYTSECANHSTLQQEIKDLKELIVEQQK